jgi:hypothetical protein
MGFEERKKITLTSGLWKGSLHLTNLI